MPGDEQEKKKEAIITFLNDFLRLLSDPGIAQKPPLPLFADLALQIMFFWNLPVNKK